MSVERDRTTPIPRRPARETARASIPRRTALQLLGSAGAALGLPSAAETQHPMHQHVGDPFRVEFRNIW